MKLKEKAMLEQQEQIIKRKDEMDKKQLERIKAM
jgi:hypothetical protein